MRTGPIVAVLAAAALTLAGCGLLGEQAEAVTVGVDLPLTGDRAALGTTYHNALLLRLEQLNDDGGLPGGRQLVLDVRDNRSEPQTSGGNLRQLIDEDGVDAVISSGCPQCLIEIAPQLDVPVISLDGLDTVVTPVEQRRWLFKVGPSPADNADLISQGIAATDAATIGVIALDDEYGQVGAQQMQDAADRDGLQIVTSVVAADPVAAAATVAAWTPETDPFPPPQPPPPTGPDAVAIWVPAPASVEVAAALRQRGYQGDLYLDTMAADQLFVPLDGPLEGARLVSTGTTVIDGHILTTPTAAVRRTWWSSYIATHGTYDIHSTWAGDAINLVVFAASYITGEIGRGNLRDAIELTRYDGLTGLLQLNSGRHNAVHPGSFVLLEADSERWR